MSAEPLPRRVDFPLDPEAILYAVIRYLLAHNLKEPARYLTMASVDIVLNSRDVTASITVEGSPQVVDYFQRLDRATDPLFGDEDWNSEDRVAHRTIELAFEHALPNPVTLEKVEARLLVSEVADGWRTDILRELDGQGGHNQGLARADEEIITWRNLRFRSFSEMKIAEALDRAGVMFFPNCRGRLGLQRRGNLEPDFLVCHKGAWGILEVDGEPFHPPTPTVHDHDRDRPFLRHGIGLVQHFDATRCRNDPDGVVAEFLALLER